MSIADLRKKFIVDEDVLKHRLEPVIEKALKHCRIDKQGQVLVNNERLRAADKVRLILSARAIASELDSSISADVSVAEIAKYTGLPANQVRARSMDAIRERFAESRHTGAYRALAHKVEAFLDSIEVVERAGD
jgi:hypothetical protein